jgi:hypothetical protein
MIYGNHPKKILGGKMHKARGTVWNKSTQIRWFSGQSDGRRWPGERQPKALRTKLALWGPSGSNPLRSYGSHDGQAGGWTALTVAKGIKGTVSRDFLCPVFFIKQCILVPIGMPRNDFKFLWIFVELFVFVINSPAMNILGSRLESFSYSSFCKHKSHVPRDDF